MNDLIKSLNTLTTGVIFGLFGADDYEGKLIFHKGITVTSTG